MEENHPALSLSRRSGHSEVLQTFVTAGCAGARWTGRKDDKGQIRENHNNNK